MSDETPSDPNNPRATWPGNGTRREVPPFRPDLNLIGDMNKREKSDPRPKRRWFRRRQHAA